MNWKQMLQCLLCRHSKVEIYRKQVVESCSGWKRTTMVPTGRYAPCPKCGKVLSPEYDEHSDLP